MHGKHIAGNAAKIGGTQSLVAFQEQARSEQQKDSKTYFQGKQPFAQANRSLPRAERTR